MREGEGKIKKTERINVFDIARTGRRKSERAERRRNN
jgi:hypothetical protein